MTKLKASMLALAMMGAAVRPGGVWASSAKPHAHRTLVNGTFKGPSVNMQWGTVQVTIVVKKSKIINVKATAPKHTSRSALINSVALPLLKKEVLKAQSAKISTISGATLTSGAYIASLKGALKVAHL
jgi:uncharacterized protein with FMN-binding domain